MNAADCVFTIHIILVGAGFEGIELRADDGRRATVASVPGGGAVPEGAVAVLVAAGYRVAREGESAVVTLPEAAS